MSSFYTELFLRAAKIVQVKTVTADGTSAINSDGVDVSGYEGVVFFSTFGTAATGNLIKVQASSDDGVVDGYSDLEGTSVSSGASDETVASEVKRPVKAWARAVITRGTSSTMGNIYAILYGPRTLPVSNNVTGTIASESAISPAEGTA
jgi:hypothetical protein